jgi:general stress protein 26
MSWNLWGHDFCPAYMRESPRGQQAMKECENRWNIGRHLAFQLSQLQRIPIMPTPTEIEAKFWKELKSDMTMMLGLTGVDESHMRPMTAQLDGERGPIWFFGSVDSELVQNMKSKSQAVATFVSKGNDLYATVHGALKVENSSAMVDRLWSPFIAAWYEGKDDPKLALLRFDANRAQVWLEGSSLMAGIKMLLGVDPKENYKDNVAELKLNRAR